MTPERRKQEYRKLIDKVESLQENEEITDASADVGEILEEANVLFAETQRQADTDSCAVKTITALLDSAVLSGSSDILHMSSNAIDVDINSYDHVAFGKRLGQLMYEDETLFDRARSILRCPPCLSFMYGAHGSGTQWDVPRKQKQRPKKVAELAQKRAPEKVKSLEKEEDSVDDTVQFIEWVLRREFRRNGKRPLNYFKCLVNPDCFANTVENMFHFSFIIRDGKASLKQDENFVPLIEFPNKSKHEQTTEKSNSQALVTITMDDWKELVQLFNIDECLLSKWKNEWTGRATQGK